MPVAVVFKALFQDLKQAISFYCLHGGVFGLMQIGQKHR